MDIAICFPIRFSKNHVVLKIIQGQKTLFLEGRFDQTVSNALATQMIVGCSAQLLHGEVMCELQPHLAVSGRLMGYILVYGAKCYAMAPVTATPRDSLVFTELELHITESAAALEQILFR
jgi:hypothetical protein